MKISTRFGEREEINGEEKKLKILYISWEQISSTNYNKMAYKKPLNANFFQMLMKKYLLKYLEKVMSTSLMYLTDHILKTYTNRNNVNMFQ